ncbi:unnamed protein product [Larinioides sclopetarius]|uniref:Uncharacterized protein n=1 Tax=Larinioides sclopetarius TaxID=280406 RepID=A0AAV2AUU1_9ARAC
MNSEPSDVFRQKSSNHLGMSSRFPGFPAIRRRVSRKQRPLLVESETAKVGTGKENFVCRRSRNRLKDKLFCAL